MNRGVRTFVRCLAALICVAGAGCATTTVRFAGEPPAGSLCQAPGESLKALVVWNTHWRPDQKEPAKREAMAEEGIRKFLDRSGCYAEAELRRGEAGEVDASVDRVVVITVRELGPIVRLFGSPALVEGGTDVRLDIVSFDPKRPASRVAFSVHWQNGGPWALKGVTSLPEDMEAAVAAALRPARI